MTAVEAAMGADQVDQAGKAGQAGQVDQVDPEDLVVLQALVQVDKATCMQLKDMMAN